MNRLESGTIVLEHKPFDLTELLEETCGIIQMQGQAHRLRFQAQPWGIQHPHLLGSPLHLRQVLQNIGGNAVKYNRDGGSITIRCEETGCADGKASFRFVCDDTGRGMSREFQKHAFEPFTQEEYGARTSYTGTGLGLSIAKQLVEKMGGDVRIQSQRDVGTRVEIDLSFDVDQSYEAAARQTEQEGRIDLTGKPLGEALYTRVALEADNGPYIAVCPVNHTGDRHSPSAWKMTNAMPSWSWTGCEERKANVEVYARAARVELVLNGHTVGSKTLKNDCLARFRIPYESGTLEAVSYDAADHEIGRCKLQSAGSTTRLTLDAEEPTVKPGHLCYIRLRYTDENGITKPLARGNIQVQVRGGTLVGLGSACPFNKHSYLDSETDTYYGEALAIVRMGDGDAMTIAASDGEYSAELTVPAQA